MGEICPRSDPDISHVKYPLTNLQIWTPPWEKWLNYKKQIITDKSGSEFGKNSHKGLEKNQ